VSRLFGTEGGGERGRWVAYSNGSVVAEGDFFLTATDKGSFTINTGDFVFDSLRFDALAYPDNNNTTDSSDYFLTGLSATGPESANTIYQTTEYDVFKGDLSNSLLMNDSDPEGHDFTVTAVSGTVEDDWTVLTSGAKVHFNSDGTFIYDPNDAFDSLQAGEVTTDSFEYTITDDFGATDTATATITIIGQGEGNTISGTSGDDILTGSTGYDIIDGGEGHDTIYAAAGDDTIVFDSADAHVDGGSGTDTLVISDAPLDFSRVTNIERLDLNDPAAQEVNLTLDDVLDMTGVDQNGIHVLEITGGDGDSVKIDRNGWEQDTTDKGLFSMTDATGTHSVHIVSDAGADNHVQIITDLGDKIG